MEKLKLKEVAALLNETPAIVRNWVRDYKGLIPIEKGENNYNLFGPQAVEVLRTIQRMARTQGYSTRQIEAYLSSGLIGAEETAAAAVPDQADEIGELKVIMQQVLDNQQRQEEFNRQLVDRLDARDRQLTQYITERRQLEAAKQQEEQSRRQPWWKFGRGKG